MHQEEQGQREGEGQERVRDSSGQAGPQVGCAADAAALHKGQEEDQEVQEAQVSQQDPVSLREERKGSERLSQAGQGKGKR